MDSEVLWEVSLLKVTPVSDKCEVCTKSQIISPWIIHSILYSKNNIEFYIVY